MYEQLLVANVGLSVGGNMATIAGLQGALGFIHAATELGYPANSLMFIRTPSDPTIGTLHYGYHEDGAGKYATLPNILIGRDIKDTVVRLPIRQPCCILEGGCRWGHWHMEDGEE